MSYLLTEQESPAHSQTMGILGWMKTTLLDFPGKVASTLFFGGCNFRCPYCHNPELVDSKSDIAPTPLDLEEIFSYLSTYNKMIEGICLSGGEPLLHKGLFDLCRQLRSLGMKIKLDTNGSLPKRIGPLLEYSLLDYVAVDIKGPPDKIHTIARYHEEAKDLAGDVKATVDLLRKAEIPYELRTTVVPGLLEASDLHAIGSWMEGSPKFVLQQFRSEKTLDLLFQNLPSYPPQYLRDLAGSLSRYFQECTVRGVD